MLHFSGVASAFMKSTALIPPLEFPLEQSQYLIWFLSGCCQVMMGFY